MTGMDSKTANQPNPFEMLLASGRAFTMTLADGTHIEVPATSPQTSPQETSRSPQSPQDATDGDGDVASGDGDIDVPKSPTNIPKSPSDVPRDVPMQCPQVLKDIPMPHESPEGDVGDVLGDVGDVDDGDALTDSLADVLALFEAQPALNAAAVRDALGISIKAAQRRLERLSHGPNPLIKRVEGSRGVYVLSQALPPSTACTPHTRAACQREIEDRNSINRKFLPSIEKPLTTIISYGVDSKREIGDMSREEGIPPFPPSPSPSLSNTSLSTSTSPPRPATPGIANPKAKRVYTRCQSDYCSNRISAALRRQGSELCQDCLDADAASAADVEAEAAYEYADSKGNSRGNNSFTVFDADDDDGEEDDSFGGTYNRPVSASAPTVAPAPAPARTFLPSRRAPSLHNPHLTFDED